MTSGDKPYDDTRPPDPPGARFRPDLVYSAQGSRLHVYVRTAPGERRPCVVLIHGGGWQEYDAFMLIRYAHRLAAAGYVAVAIDFRQVGEAPWPACLHDAKCAVRWVRAHAEELGADRDRVVVAGNSAGGQLAALIAATPGEQEGSGGWHHESSAVASAFLIYPVVDLRPEAGEWQRDQAIPVLFGADGDRAEITRASPMARVHSAMPPVWTVTGDRDQIVLLEQVQRYHAELDRHGVSNQLHVVEGDHGFDWAPAGWELTARLLLNHLAHVADLRA